MVCVIYWQLKLTVAGKAQAGNDILDPRARGESLKTASVQKRGSNQLELLIAGCVV